jgi:predicted RNA binding protein YcfA (HicA-like mRNA interferase family)
MGRLTPITRGDLIRLLQRLGFTGPYSGGNHEFMLRGIQRLILPNPHRGDVSVDLLTRLLRQVSITREEWESS